MVVGNVPLLAPLLLLLLVSLLSQRLQIINNNNVALHSFSFYYVNAGMIPPSYDPEPVFPERPCSPR